MASNKLVAMLLMVCLIVAAGAVETNDKKDDSNEITPQATSEQCFRYCYKACALPAGFCNWMCGLRCKNPIFFDPGKPGQSSSLIVSQSPVQSPMPSMSMAEEHNKKLH
uniref:Uncharacterized protein n=1 Tax=Lotus japonicus TaxID=34305 RepID=I3SDS9_LOTJA|nr:unknown [Lotus japonicus]